MFARHIKCERCRQVIGSQYERIYDDCKTSVADKMNECFGGVINGEWLCADCYDEVHEEIRKAEYADEEAE